MNGMMDMSNNSFYLGVILDCFSPPPPTPFHPRNQIIGKSCPFCLKIQLESSVFLQLLAPPWSEPTSSPAGMGAQSPNGSLCLLS